MAQTYKFGKGTWATKKGSTLAYNDQNNYYKPLPFNFTRGSIATRVNKQGLIEVVGQDIPRIDYTDSTKGVLLLEPQSINLQTYSSDLASVYAPTEITQTSNYGISPDGTQTSSRVVLDNLSTSRSVEILTGVLVSGTTYTFSCYYKGVKGETTYMYFLSSTGGTNIAKQILFNGQWQRESITFTAGSASNYTYIVDTRQGSSTATDFEVWGGQVEAQSYPTSYIPTNGSTVTRSADVANGSGNSEVFSDSQGVLFANISFLDSNASANYQLSLSDGSGNNRIMIYPFSDNQLGLRFNANTVQLVSQTIDVQNLKNYSKLTIKWNSNNYSIYQNGFEVYSQSITDTPIGLDRINFGSVTNTNNLIGETKELGYYDAVLTDAELETLTSYVSLSEMVTELNLNTL